MASRRPFFSVLSACAQLKRPQACLRVARYLSYGHRRSGRTTLNFTPQRSLIITTLTLPFFRKGKAPGSPAPDPALPSTTPIEVSRIMLPDDTNPSGNVHGGTILKMIEHAGHIVANRHCNRQRKDADAPPITTALVRLEKMDFHQSMHVGEIAQLQAAVTYTSPHSMEVVVDVWAENVITGERRHTNTAYLWYVGLAFDEDALSRKTPLRDLIVPVPQLHGRECGLAQSEIEAGRRRYEMQKRDRGSMSASSSSSSSKQSSDSSSSTKSPPPPPPPAHTFSYPEEVEPHSVRASQTTLANVVLPSDCTVTGHMLGGALMKAMDNAAGICATRHCRGRTVTACIDVINFHEEVVNGDMVFVTARMVFTSTKSMEIEVTTEAEGLRPGGRHVTSTAYFTFVHLGEDGRAQTVPPLKLEGGEERRRFEEGKERYTARKAARLAKKASQQQNVNT